MNFAGGFVFAKRPTFTLLSHFVAPKDTVADTVMIAAVKILVNVILYSFVIRCIHIPNATSVPESVFWNENLPTSFQALIKAHSQCEIAVPTRALECAHPVRKVTELPNEFSL